LAEVFYRLQLIEAYGTGIQKIFEAYKTSLAQPKIEVTPNVFKMILPNLNIASIINEKETPEERIMQYVHENGSINRKQAEHLLGVSQTAAGLVLRGLVEQGELPDIDSYVGLAHTSFALEDLYGVRIGEIDGEVCLRLDKSKGMSYLSMFDIFTAWQQQAEKLTSGEITKEEYDDWRYNYPQGKTE
jgi:hypothetical protein